MTTFWTESQTFWNNVILRVAMVLTGVVLVGLTVWGASEGLDGEAVATMVVGLGILLLVSRLTLRTRVTDEGLKVRLAVLSKTYRWEDIASAEVRTYNPILEYGGWGLRLFVSGWAWNVHGDEGVQLVLTSGTRVLVGSQEAPALAAQIRAKMGECDR